MFNAFTINEMHNKVASVTGETEFADFGYIVSHEAIHNSVVLVTNELFI